MLHGCTAQIQDGSRDDKKEDKGAAGPAQVHVRFRHASGGAVLVSKEMTLRPVGPRHAAAGGRCRAGSEAGLGAAGMGRDKLLLSVVSMPHATRPLQWPWP